MDNIAAAIVYVIAECTMCGKELAIAEYLSEEIVLCADCDRPKIRYALTEDVVEIEDDCA